ncbi:hypothetical protein NE237_001795 [Protea cynaroides]|uniref:Uncharacterized protein n=1 Tax=Protea cynaroides TaxID=273540 RepID=A0A9Q0KUT5_9MAGN|nr:hypothetical protein NE237_001795 [Protea cynaroides]
MEESIAGGGVMNIGRGSKEDDDAGKVTVSDRCSKEANDGHNACSSFPSVAVRRMTRSDRVCCCSSKANTEAQLHAHQGSQKRRDNNSLINAFSMKQLFEEHFSSVDVKL